MGGGQSTGGAAPPPSVLQRAGGAIGNAFFGSGQQQGSFMGPMQPATGFGKVMPYLNSFLQGQGIAGQLAGGLTGMGQQEGGYDTGLLGKLLANMHQGGGQGLLAGFTGMPQRGVVQGPTPPQAQGQPGIIRGLISGYTGGILGGHTGAQ